MSATDRMDNDVGWYHGSGGLAPDAFRMITSPAYRDGFVEGVTAHLRNRIAYHWRAPDHDTAIRIQTFRQLKARAAAAAQQN